MQAKMKTELYEYFDPVFDGNYEVAIDTEYNLPDYCSDIQRVLKCRAIPEISSYIVSENTIICDGICDIRVMYLDGMGDCVRCCDFTKEFSASIKIKTSEEKAVACIKAAVEHMTCRAVSARRIDLHMAICLNVYAVVQKKEQITSEVDDKCIERKSENVRVSQAINAVCHQFFIEDYLPLKNGKPPIDNIIRRDVSCKVSEFRAMSDRLSVSGTADISFLYTSVTDGIATEKMNASLDFTQIIECSGMDEDCISDIKIVAGETSVQPKEDNVGEYTGVNVFVKMFLVLFVYKEKEISMIGDAYSVGAPVEFSYSQNTFMQVHNIFSEVLKKKCAITVNDEEIQKIVDIWCEQNDVTSFCDKGKLNYRVKYNICMLYLNIDNKILYTEKIFDFNFMTELDNSIVKKSDTTSKTDIWEYRITDKNTVEVSVESMVTSLLYSKSSMKYLTSAIIDEDTQNAAKNSKFKVYYAEKNENLWDIAKNHKAHLSDLQAQNDLFEDVVSEPGPIIICNR